MKQVKYRMTLVEGSETRLDHHQEQAEKKDEAYQKEVGRSVGLALQLGFAIIIPLIASVALGRWIDSKLHTAPAATLILLGIGFLVSMAQLWLIARGVSRQNSKT